MNFTAQLAPNIVPRYFFKCMTRISIQVRAPGTLFLAKEQGEINNQNDGTQITQGSTQPPYDCWWKGEMWYRSDTPNLQWVMLIIGTED
jgi:hypothetical protein